MQLKDAKYGRLLNDNYEDALSLQNRYNFVNANVFPLLSEKQQKFMLELEDLCLKFYPTAQANLNDVYAVVQDFVKATSTYKTYTYEEFWESNRLQIISTIVNTIGAPEIVTAYGASMLCIRALMHNPNRTEVQEKAYQEMIEGSKIGGMGITEPMRGSDAVNMETTASIDYEKKTITYNGIKIFTTNGAVADYFTAYGVLDASNPRGTMLLTLFKREDLGISSERLSIPAFEPGVGIGRVIYDNVTVPLDRMIAPPGVGYIRLFRGLVPERLGIIGGAIGYIWDALAQGTIYTQMRQQFGKTLFKNQGISYVLGDIYSQIAAQTAFTFQIADFYDEKILHLIHEGKSPNPKDESTAAFNAAQAKYLTCKLAPHAAYEIIQLMGGRGAIDESNSNNTMQRISKSVSVLEVMGGHRNIQMMIIEGGLLSSSLPSIAKNVKAAAMELKAGHDAVFKSFLARGNVVLTKNAEFLSEATKAALSQALTKFNTAMAEKNSIEIKAYARAIPKMVMKAEKEARKAKKAQKA
jgi:alkylation response protein AidB-like acyl-CoA dehydrogenase